MKRLVKLCLWLALTVGLIMMGHSQLEHQAGIRAYETAASIAFPPRDKPAASDAADSPVPPEEALAAVDLAALRAVNPDVVGWIEIPGTQLSYPLVLGTDNQYYLNHTWNGQRNSSGAIFLDHTTSPELDGFHTLVYGHRMDNDIMFGTLKYYKDLDFWREHPSIFLVTDGGVSQYDIFSAREADVRGLTSAWTWRAAGWRRISSRTVPTARSSIPGSSRRPPTVSLPCPPASAWATPPPAGWYRLSSR